MSVAYAAAVRLPMRHHAALGGDLGFGVGMPPSDSPLRRAATSACRSARILSGNGAKACVLSREAASGGCLLKGRAGRKNVRRRSGAGIAGKVGLAKT